MKKQYRILSMVLALTLVVSMFTGNLAFAAETSPSVISLNDFASVTTVEKDSRTTYEIEIDQPEVKLEAASSDDSILKTNLVDEDSGYYTLVLEAYKEGDATVTLTASDGTTVSQKVTVQDTGYEWDYTAEADQTDDFSMPSANSRYIKIHYENSSAETYTFPTLVSDHPDDVSVALAGYEDEDYYYRVDALGTNGQSAALYIGSSDYVVAQKLCNVTIAENSDLSIDTKSTYVCSLFDTYHFVVHTKSGTAPEVTACNDNITVTPVGKVEGGYEYVMEAEHEGESLVQAKLNGEIAGFAVSVSYDDPPSVVYDDSEEISVERGQTYTYKFSIMGGGEPSFAPDQAGAFTVQSVRKDGIDYYCTIAATGTVGSSASLLVSFPNSDESDTVNAGKVTVAKQVGKILESDTNYDFSLAKGSSYLFRITGGSSFYAGSSGVFTVSKEKTSGNDTYYRITATGKVGEAAGFYMYAPGCVPLKVCAVTVAPVKITSDTNRDFELTAGKSYQFKITAPGVDSIQFNAGSSGVVQPVLVKHSGNDFFYKITAVGKPGQQTGIYASVLGQDAVKICVVTVGQIKAVSDTNSDFSLAAGASYQFKITAPGASSVNFTAGSSGVVQTSLVKHSGDDFYFKVTGKGKSGQQTGIYLSVPNQDYQKVCVITIK